MEDQDSLKLIVQLYVVIQLDTVLLSRWWVSGVENMQVSVILSEVLGKHFQWCSTSAA